MVSKRNKSSVAIQQQDSHTEIQFDLDRPNLTTRRSGRIVRQKIQELHSEDKPISDVSANLASNQPKGKKKKMLEDLGDVSGAMNGLRAMENNFRESVKRQKIALNESSVMEGGKIEDEDAAFMPRPSKAMPDLIPEEFQKRGLQDKQKRNDLKMRSSHADHASEVYPEGEPCDRDGGGDIGAEEVDVATIKQEGSRPPPVHSEYLPLPWKGRLGYVNIPDCHALSVCWYKA